MSGTATCCWLLSLSCWYLLCSRTACSNKGRFIPSTQVSTRAFTTEPPSERHQHKALAVTDPCVSHTPYRCLRAVSLALLLGLNFNRMSLRDSMWRPGNFPTRASEPWPRHTQLAHVWNLGDSLKVPTSASRKGQVDVPSASLLGCRFCFYFIYLFF